MTDSIEKLHKIYGNDFFHSSSEQGSRNHLNEIATAIFGNWNVHSEYKNKVRFYKDPDTKMSRWITYKSLDKLCTEQQDSVIAPWYLPNQKNTGTRYKGTLDKELLGELAGKKKYRYFGYDYHNIELHKTLKEAYFHQVNFYGVFPSIRKRPIVITLSFIDRDSPDGSYGWHYEDNPELGLKTREESYPSHTSYIVAVLQPV